MFVIGSIVDAGLMNTKVQNEGSKFTHSDPTGDWWNGINPSVKFPPPKCWRCQVVPYRDSAWWV
eukprot:9141138-Lingulodinium_polyedra.AAC.1